MFILLLRPLGGLMLVCGLGVVLAVGWGRLAGGGTLTYALPARTNPYIDLYLFDTRTRIEHNLTQHPGNDTLFSWSPDGTHLAFTSTRGRGAPGLFLMNAAGRRIERYASELVAFQPFWSPDGRAIALSGQRGSSLPAVQVVPLDGAGTLSLTNGAVRADLVQWSPDSQMLLIMQGDPPALFIASAQANAPLQRLPLPAAARPQRAAWSPDGAYIAYTDAAAGTLMLYTLAAAQTRPLHDGSEVISAPAWSPDGRFIAFVVLHSNQVALRLVEAASGQGRDAIIGFWRIEWPVWSPDGRQIAFYGEPADDAAARGLYAWEPASGTLTLLKRERRLNSLVWQPGR